MQIATEHPVLFLSDEGPHVTVPDVTGDTFACSSIDCLSFYVLAYVDGASLVIVTDQTCDRGGTKVFTGTIATRSGVLIVNDSYRFAYLRIPVPPGEVPVEIWAADDRNPEWVWLKVGAIRAY
jgi:hypothetical protein